MQLDSSKQSEVTARWKKDGKLASATIRLYLVGRDVFPSCFRVYLLQVNMPATCLVCHKTATSSNHSMHRFPPKSAPAKRQQWLKAFQLEEHQVLDHHRVCSRHFPNGDISQAPSLNLGRRFASPKKMTNARGVRAAKRRRLCSPPSILSRNTPSNSCEATSATVSDERRLSPLAMPSRSTTSSSREATPATLSDERRLSPPSIPSGNGTTPTSSCEGASVLSNSAPPSSSDFDFFSGEESSFDTSSVISSVTSKKNDTEVIINTALVARIEMLEAEKKSLMKKLSGQKPKLLRLEEIASNNKLVRFYTGFESYDTLMSFFEFLGDAVNHLQYWGSKPSSKRSRKTKLNPINQLLLTLMKLRLDLRERDLATRFGISVSSVSKYFITWVCFLYRHLSELNWMPEVEQVKATLPHAFKDKYPQTYLILDATELFIETPTDLHIQSSTWSNYKHHNTAKFLVGCTPNGAIIFVSELYVGSISDVELTRVSGLIQMLSGKSDICVMADRGFTIRDQLSAINVGLNIPPFLEGRGQLPACEVLKGRKIASVRIHVERAINRIKCFSILKTCLPITLSRIANQIVCVCCWLVNFQPILISPPSDDDTEVDEFLQSLCSSESGSSDDESCSD